MMACEQKMVKIRVNVRFKVKMGHFQYNGRSCMKARLFQHQAKKGQDVSGKVRGQSRVKVRFKMKVGHTNNDVQGQNQSD